MMPGVPERRTRDYVRAGTTTLLAALEVATGILTRLDEEGPSDCEVHLILDNYATHKTPAIKQWLLARPRFHCTSHLLDHRG